MTFNFSSILASIESFFHIAESEPAVVAQSANEIIEAAKPAIDAVAGAGTAQTAEEHVTATATKLTTIVQPYLQDAAMAEPLVNAVVATLSQAAATKAASTTTAPVATTAPSQNDTTQAQTPAS